MNELQPITHLPDEPREQRRKTRETTRQIYRGTSIKTNCDSCGFPTERLECHHHDYNCPEKVSFLCRICHNEYHQNSGVTISYANEFKNRAKWLKENKEISDEYAKYIKEMIIFLEKKTYADRLRPLQFTRNHTMNQRFLSPRWNEAPRKGGRPKTSSQETNKTGGNKMKTKYVVEKMEGFDTYGEKKMFWRISYFENETKYTLPEKFFTKKQAMEEVKRIK